MVLGALATIVLLFLLWWLLMRGPISDYNREEEQDDALSFYQKYELQILQNEGYHCKFYLALQKQNLRLVLDYAMGRISTDTFQSLNASFLDLIITLKPYVASDLGLVEAGT